jgi:hypothetical protein
MGNIRFWLIFGAVMFVLWFLIVLPHMSLPHM